ncbi:MAG: tRNA-guanine transglycosylase [Chloroflexi bacterium]|nr:tRNA-guanine transglycosylase [Chloroflexota bacterium]
MTAPCPPAMRGTAVYTASPSIPPPANWRASGSSTSTPMTKKQIKANLPVSEFCDCHTCRHYTLGYLHHLYKVNDALFPRLATIHNLRFMTMMMAALRTAARQEMP